MVGPGRGALHSRVMSTPTELLNQALALPRGERASLARELIASLDDPHDDPAAVEAAWLEEIERRVQEVKDGTAELVDWETVRAEALERLRKR